ncbi:MAG: hypothetical protein GY801_06135 [bacterium]|nr:hypothetical protein [bacterium]
MTIQETKTAMKTNPEHWLIPFMNFVDHFRRTRRLDDICEPFECDDERWDALLASTIEYLCHEQGLDVPEWVWNVASCRFPWFVAGVESLKALTLVESPVYFRQRKIFVLENFLVRV